MATQKIEEWKRLHLKNRIGYTKLELKYALKYTDKESILLCFNRAIDWLEDCKKLVDTK